MRLEAIRPKRCPIGDEEDATGDLRANGWPVVDVVDAFEGGYNWEVFPSDFS